MKIQDLRGKMMGGASKRSVSSIKKLGRHHSGTNAGDAYSFERFWRDDRKWNTGGYHEIILRDGTVQLCYDDNVITNGIYGHNNTTYHICVVGNGQFTKEQEEAFEVRAKEAMKRFNLKPSDVLGHNEFSGQNTSCPGINMNTVRQRLSKQPVKVAPAPLKPKEEPFMLEKAIVINSFADFPNAEVLAIRIKAPIYLKRTATGNKVAKEIIIVGGNKDGLVADKFTVLSGKDRFETAANVKKFIS